MERSAAAIAWSRVYSNAHHLSDVMVGALLGLMTASFVWEQIEPAVDRLLRKYFQQEPGARSQEFVGAKQRFAPNQMSSGAPPFLFVNPRSFPSIKASISPSMTD